MPIGSSPAMQVSSPQADGPTRLGNHVRYTYKQKTVTLSDEAFELALLKSATSIVGHASWPLAAVAIAYLFKADLSKMMERLKEFSGLGIHANLDSIIQSSLPAATPPADLRVAQGNDVTSLPPQTHNTLDAVITAWLRVEAAMNKFLGLDPLTAQATPLKSKLAEIKADPNLSTSLKNLIIELSSIRNRVARSKEEISADSINLFVANADKAASELLIAIRQE